jgi:hypothetical protein
MTNIKRTMTNGTLRIFRDLLTVPEIAPLSSTRNRNAP